MSTRNSFLFKLFLLFLQFFAAFDVFFAFAIVTSCLFCRWKTPFFRSIGKNTHIFSKLQMIVIIFFQRRISEFVKKAFNQKQKDRLIIISSDFQPQIN
jgi:hypothetical protein